MSKEAKTPEVQETPEVTKAPTLYELTDKYTKVLAFIEASDGEMDDETMELFAEAEQNLDGKIDNCCRLLANWTGEEAIYREEVKRLGSRARTLANQQKRLKDYMTHELEISGRQEVKTPLFHVKLVQKPPSCIVTDEALVPEDFTRTKVETDKSAVVAAWKDCGGAEDIPGTEVRQMMGIRIR